jgi:hypothetical protein
MNGVDGMKRDVFLRQAIPISQEEVMILIMSDIDFAVWYGYFDITDAFIPENQFVINREDQPAIVVRQKGKMFYRYSNMGVYKDKTNW